MKKTEFAKKSEGLNRKAIRMSYGQTIADYYRMSLNDYGYWNHKFIIQILIFYKRDPATVYKRDPATGVGIVVRLLKKLLEYSEPVSDIFFTTISCKVTFNLLE